MYVLITYNELVTGANLNQQTSLGGLTLYRSMVNWENQGKKTLGKSWDRKMMGKTCGKLIGKSWDKLFINGALCKRRSGPIMPCFQLGR